MEEVSAYIPLPAGTKGNMIDVKLGVNDFRLALKSNPKEPLLEGKWCKKINAGESIWNLERDGQKSTLAITLEKYDGKNWWNCLI